MIISLKNKEAFCISALSNLQVFFQAYRHPSVFADFQVSPRVCAGWGWVVRSLLTPFAHFARELG